MNGMIMRILFAALLISLTCSVTADELQAKLSVKTLITSKLEAINSHKAMVTHVSIPAHFTLPKHFHPSEEFLYVIEGSTILQIEGQEDQLVKAGMAAKIPARAIHTAITENMPSEVIVFRVHPSGQPVRMSPTEKK